MTLPAPGLSLCRQRQKPVVLPNSHSVGCLLYYCTSLIKSCLKNPSSPYSESSSCTDSSDETSAVIRSTTVYLLIVTDSSDETSAVIRYTTVYTDHCH